MTEVDRFDEFYRGTRDRVLRCLYGLTGDLGEAQDSAQEAYARAWQRWDRVSAYADPEAWVRTVGWRIAASRWRRSRNRLRAYRRHGAAAATSGPSEDGVALAAALQQLPLAQRRAIVLHHLMDLPVAEVARECGSPVGTVKAQLARGRRALSTLLAVDLPEDSHV